MFASLYNPATSSENILLPETISGRFVAEAFQRSIGWQCVTTGRYPHGWERDPRRYFRLRWTCVRYRIARLNLQQNGLLGSHAQSANTSHTRPVKPLKSTTRVLRDILQPGPHAYLTLCQRIQSVRLTKGGPKRRIFRTPIDLRFVVTVCQCTHAGYPNNAAGSATWCDLHPSIDRYLQVFVWIKCESTAKLDSPVGSEVHCYIVSCEEVRLCSSKSSCLTRSLLLLSTHFQYPKVAAVSIPAKAEKIHNRDHDTVNVPAPLVAKNCMPKIVYNGRLSKNLRSHGLANMERLTATNDDGRNNNVTTVITRIVADSLTAASFNASVFPLIL